MYGPDMVISAVIWNSPGQKPETSFVVPRDHMKVRFSLGMSGMGKSLVESEPLPLRGLEGQQVAKGLMKAWIIAVKIIEIFTI